MSLWEKNEDQEIGDFESSAPLCATDSSAPENEIAKILAV
jgi:hypothetical protein